jgi:hypothetical protein
MESILRQLGQSGAIPDRLCESLDYVRWNTYFVVWGTAGPSSQVLYKVRQGAAEALPELARISEKTNFQTLRPNPDSPCSRHPVE